MKKVRIELKWEWKLEGAWGATIVMVALLQLPHLLQVCAPGAGHLRSRVTCYGMQAQP